MYKGVARVARESKRDEAFMKGLTESSNQHGVITKLETPSGQKDFERTFERTYFTKNGEKNILRNRVCQINPYGKVARTAVRNWSGPVRWYGKSVPKFLVRSGGTDFPYRYFWSGPDEFHKTKVVFSNI